VKNRVLDEFLLPAVSRKTEEFSHGTKKPTPFLGWAKPNGARLYIAVFGGREEH